MNNFLFRNFHDVRDYYYMAGVHWDSYLTDKLDPLSTLDCLPCAQEIELLINRDNCDPTKDIIIVEKNNKIVGYSYIQGWKEREKSYLFSHFPYVIPRYRKHQLFNQLVSWAEESIKNRIKKIKHISNIYIGSYASGGEMEKRIVLSNFNYQLATLLSEMILKNNQNITILQSSPEFKLREALKTDLEDIYKLNMKIYSNKRMTRAPNKQSYKHFIESAEKNLSLSYVVQHNNSIVAFLLTKVTKGRGEIMDLSTDPRYRKLGLATALLNKSLIKFNKIGIQEIRLHTIDKKTNVAKKLYEKFGFKHYKNHYRYRKEL